MQKLLLLLLLVVSVSLYSQTIPSTHMPRVGDTFIFAVDNSIYTPKPQSGGLYDFSDLKQDDTSVFYYQSVGSTSPVAGANLKLVIDTNETSAAYFKTTTNNMFVLSMGDIASIPFPGVSGLKGSLNQLSLPMTASTTSSSNDSIRFAIPASMIPPDFNVDSILKTLIPGLPSGATITLDSILVSIVLNLDLSVKGSGKIKTPIDNNLDVLLLERKLSISPRMIVMGKATLSVITLPISYDVTSLVGDMIPVGSSDQIQHSYYSPSFRQEIVSAVKDSMGMYQNVNWRFRTKSSSNSINVLNTNNSEVNVVFQPNQLWIQNIASDKEINCKVYDLNGKLLIQKLVSISNPSFNYSLPSVPFIIQLEEDSKPIFNQLFQIQR